MKIIQFRLLYAGLIAIICSAHPTYSSNWSEDGDNFGKLLKEANRGQWAKSRELAKSISLPVAETVVEWLRLRAGTEKFQDYVDFLDKNNDWPGLKILRKSGERALNDNVSPSLVVAYFEVQPPQTGKGAIQLAKALQRQGRQDEAHQAIIDGWKSLPFTSDQHNEALQLYSSILDSVHDVRLNNLIWNKKRQNEAKRLLNLVDHGKRQLAKTRMALQNRSNGVDSRIRSIPDNLRNDTGLSYDRVVWRLIEGFEDTALDLFLQTSSSSNQIANPEYWAKRRLSLAHSQMRKGNHEQAYNVASNHHLMKNNKFPDLTSLSAAHRDREERDRNRNFAALEWLSGYLQLTFLDNASLAVKHFSAFSKIVDTPISIGRAGYWLGLAYEATGDDVSATNAYQKAASEQTTFYGQLAAEKIGARTDIRFAQTDPDTLNGSSKLLQIPVVQAGLLYFHAGNDSHSAWFLAHVAETLSHEDSKNLAAIAFSHGAHFATVKVAKENVKNGFTDVTHLFPLVGISDYDLPIPAEIALAVARQETEFRDTAVSSREAVGYMQIKPSTGAELAKNIGLAGPIKQLLRQRKTNVLLGSTYIFDRIIDFDGSLVMAIASYNAGPRRIRDWLPLIGDPRTGKIDPIDWIEHIPYGETRNYVMRVLEAKTVYQMRLDGKTQKIALLSDLRRGTPN